MSRGAVHDLEGRVVNEEEVASGLGFKDVFELRRWQTDVGHKVEELEYALRKSKNEGERFRYAGRRMGIVLKKIDGFLDEIKASLSENKCQELETLQLAIGVVFGGKVDWDHKLKDWFVSDDLGPLIPNQPS